MIHKINNYIVMDSEIMRKYPSLILEYEFNLNEILVSLNVHKIYQFKSYRMCKLEFETKNIKDKLSNAELELIHKIKSSTYSFISKINKYSSCLRNLVVNKHIINSKNITEINNRLKSYDDSLSDLYINCITSVDLLSNDILIKIMKIVKE